MKKHNEIFLPLVLAALALGPGAKLKGEQAEQNDDAKSRIEKELPHLGLSASDVELPAGLDLPLTILPVEKLFSAPLELFPVTAAWREHLKNSRELSDAIEFSRGLLQEGKIVDQQPAENISEDDLSTVPLSLRPSVERLIKGLREALPRLKESVDSLSPEDREAVLSYYGVKSGNPSLKISRAEQKNAIDRLKNFNQTPLLQAGRTIFHAVDDVLPGLKDQLAEETISTRIRIKTSVGDVLIGTSGDDTYTEKALDGVVLLIDPGGKNHYETPPAKAETGEIRIAIDMGSDVDVKSPSHLKGGAGSGIFGIGIFCLPTMGGKKTLSTGSFSQGCGVAGIGALSIQGESHLTGGRYVQGAGVVGVGVLWMEEADHSSLSAVQSGQGFALTRGVGILRLKGNDAAIEGGLVEPDPREALGSASLCQGAGFGPRAYAGGGIGIAQLLGDRLHVSASYFAQGVGYWHGVGLFDLEGSSNTLQARRYDLGSGVHSAFGHFHLNGSDNTILNWGVGPAYGWDRSLGSALIEGSRNHIQAEWGAGAASIGSFSFSILRGDDNSLILPEFGNGSFTHNDLGFALHIIDGRNNLLKNDFDFTPAAGPVVVCPNPWGRIIGYDLHFSSGLTLRPVEWPAPKPNNFLDDENIDLSSLLGKAPFLPPDQRVDSLVDIAAAFSVDKATPRDALKLLLSLAEEDLPFLIQSIDPVAIDQLIQLKTVVPVYGEKITRLMTESLEGDLPSTTKVLLLGFLDTSPAGASLPALLEYAVSVGKYFDPRPDVQIRARASSLRALNHLASVDIGEDPGVLALLGAAEDALKQASKETRAAALALFSKTRYPEGFYLLSRAKNPRAEDRLLLLDAGPADVTASLGEKGAEVLLHLLETKKTEGNLKADLYALRDNQSSIQKAFVTALEENDKRLQVAGLVGLGEMGDDGAAEAVQPFLQEDVGLLRYQASISLARMGQLSWDLTALPAEKKARAASFSQPARNSWEIENLLPLFKKAFEDPDPELRALALASLRARPDSPKDEKATLTRAAQSQLSSDPDPSVQFALRSLK